MPHVILKLLPGKSQQQKADLADEIVKAITTVLKYGDESVSISMEEIGLGEWKEKVYEPDILRRPDQLYKKPGYTM